MNRNFEIDELMAGALEHRIDIHEQFALVQALAAFLEDVPDEEIMKKLSNFSERINVLKNSMRTNMALFKESHELVFARAYIEVGFEMSRLMRAHLSPAQAFLDYAMKLEVSKEELHLLFEIYDSSINGGTVKNKTADF